MARTSAGALWGRNSRVRRTGSLGSGAVAFSASRRRDRLQTCAFLDRAIGISGKPIAVDSLIEQPCLHCPGRHPFRDLSGSGGFASIIAGWLRYFFVPSPEKRLFPFHFGALWFRRLPSAPGFALILSYCFAAVHLGSAGDIVGPQFSRRDKVELESLAAEDRAAPAVRL